MTLSVGLIFIVLIISELLLADKLFETLDGAIELRHASLRLVELVSDILPDIVEHTRVFLLEEGFDLADCFKLYDFLIHHLSV